ncbi:aldehyde dehydrogenase family protein [Amycolatopsis pittospori]|uniref:aldehyde dehydrogenase family protein n=1 Tax=Amycolatopsis pittospori TaxID=2749434 RepID=UPI0015F0B694|nr:aldehyde dehydrogenase family protein [Amycolatopsis pittospori]
MEATGIDVRSPVDDRLLASVDNADAATVARIVANLRAAQPEWEALGVAERSRWLHLYRDWLLDHADDLARLLQEETGKAWPESRAEPAYPVHVINYYTKHAARFLAAESPRPASILVANKRQERLLRPYPVVGVISPWNFPLALAMMDALPALIAGAAVAIKPSELTPLATRAAVAGWREIGAPDIFACVTGAGETGAALVDEVDFVQFTGSERTGRRIAERAGARLIPCGLELGGKDAMIVLADADIERAARGAVFGALYNAGQTCVSVERVYVVAEVYDRFVDAVVAEVGRLRHGAVTPDYGIDVGAMTVAQQAEIVAEHVADARERGARVLIGGSRRGEHYYEPTVLVDVDHSMTCMRAETFGPLLPIMKANDVDEAIRLANDSPYGLSASIWTRDRALARRQAQRLEVGAVNVNDVIVNLLALPLPHGGWKASGLGARNGGPYGIRKYCRSQAVLSDRFPLPLTPHWFPYKRGNAERFARFMRTAGTRDVRRRWRAITGR